MTRGNDAGTPRPRHLFFLMFDCAWALPESIRASNPICEGMLDHARYPSAPFSDSLFFRYQAVCFIHVDPQA